jgi:P4 family phage/plasmid primase-like protien
MKPDTGSVSSSRRDDAFACLKPTRSGSQTTFNYVNEDDDLLTSITRIPLPDGGKRFTTQHVSRLNGDRRRVFLGLPLVAKAREVILVEGEQKAHALFEFLTPAKTDDLSPPWRQRPIVSTARGGSSGATLVELAPIVRKDVRITIWRDADAAGVAWERTLYRRLRREYNRANLDLDIHFVLPPAMAGGGGWDCADALVDDQYDVRKLLAGALNEKQWNALHDREGVPQDQLAEEVVEQLHPIIHTSDGFYRWTRRHVWERIDDTTVQRAIGEHLGRANTGKMLRDVLALVRARCHRDNPFSKSVDGDARSRRIFVGGSDLVISKLDGQYLEVGKIVDYGQYVLTQCDPDPEAFPLVRIPAGYIPPDEVRQIRGSTEPKRFLDFLRQAFTGDDDINEKIKLFQQFLGACLLPETVIPIVLFCYGPGATGKSTALNIIGGFLGEDSVSHVGVPDLGHRFRSYSLAGKLANLVVEVAKGQLLPDDKLKLISDGARIQIERKGHDPIDMPMTAKCAYATNFEMVTRDTSSALARRLRILTFNRVIPEEERDFDFVTSIVADSAEMILLLNWAIDGLMDLLNSGRFVDPPSSQREVARWLENSDTVAQFIADMCEVEPGARCGKSDLYRAYKFWCDDNGHQHPLSSRSFQSALLSRPGIVVDPSRAIGRCYKGIRLFDEPSSASSSDDIVNRIASKITRYDDVDRPFSVR